MLGHLEVLQFRAFTWSLITFFTKPTPECPFMVLWNVTVHKDLNDAPRSSHCASSLYMITCSGGLIGVYQPPIGISVDYLQMLDKIGLAEKTLSTSARSVCSESCDVIADVTFPAF